MLDDDAPLITVMLWETFGPDTTKKPLKFGGTNFSPLLFMVNETSNCSVVPTSVLLTDEINFTPWAKSAVVQNSRNNDM